MISLERTVTFVPGVPMWRVAPGPWLCKRDVVFGPWCYTRRTAILMWVANVSDHRDVRIHRPDLLRLNRPKA